MLGKRLKEGDTLGIIAPAGFECKENVIKNIHYLNELGFKTHIGKHVFSKKGYLAGEDLERASDFMEMFQNKNVDAILCLRGGYGSLRLLPLIDWSIIKNNPKIFIGYSDITCLLNEIQRRCNLICFHGPMLTTKLSENPDTKDSFLETLEYGSNPYKLQCYNADLSSYSASITDGYLVGGNLSLICSTLGTPYEIDTSNKILFIEDIGEEPYKIDRMLTQLTLANKLQKCRGFLLGYFSNCGSKNTRDSFCIKEIIDEKILSLNKPTLMNFPSGHDYPNVTLPIGAKIRLDCVKNEIRILESVVC
ncbi:LD-carboxypeptidase [Haloimpatiens sp. FM7315]|uniref:S66 peptidase family protein n=1 Tax=Haloimpatiens sp. FM7315 TaxID=3298609 RepID=UPI0035A29F7D